MRRAGRRAPGSAFPPPSPGKEAPPCLPSFAACSAASMRWCFCCALGLSAFSVVLLLGIQQMGVIGRRTVLMQVVAAGLGFIAAMVLAHLDYEQLGSWWKFYVPVAVVLMLLTFTPLGQTRTDSIETNRSWLNLGFTTIQPAEFLKIAFILSLAYHLSKVGASLNGSKTLLRVGPTPSSRCCSSCCKRTGAWLWSCSSSWWSCSSWPGLSCRWILLGCAAAVVFAPLAWFFLLDDYQKIRFVLLKNPEAYALGQAYQQLQGRISFGSGQLFGIGIFSPITAMSPICIMIRSSPSSGNRSAFWAHWRCCWCMACC